LSQKLALGVGAMGPVKLAKNVQTYTHYEVTHKNPQSKTSTFLSKLQDFPHL